MWAFENAWNANASLEHKKYFRLEMELGLCSTTFFTLESRHTYKLINFDLVLNCLHNNLQL